MITESYIGRIRTIAFFAFLIIVFSASSAIGSSTVGNTEKDVSKKIAEFDQRIADNPNDVQVYRDYADFLFDNDRTNSEIVKMLRTGFDHFVKTDNIEGITRVGILLAVHTRDQFPATTKRVLELVIRKSRGKNLTDNQSARVRFAEAKLDLMERDSMNLALN